MFKVLLLRSQSPEPQIAMVSGDYERAFFAMKQAIADMGTAIEQEEIDNGKLVASCGDDAFLFVSFLPRTELPGHKFQLNIDADLDSQLEIAKTRELIEAFNQRAKASAAGAFPQHTPQSNSSDLWLSGLVKVAGEPKFKHACQECGTTYSISASHANKLGRCDECGFPSILTPGSWENAS